MSAGPFTTTFYETDNGTILRARVQPETLAAAFNVAPTGPATAPGSVNISGGRRTNGVSARKLRLRWEGTPPTGYLATGIVTVAVLSPTAYNGIELGDTVVYRGAHAEVIGKTPEYVR